jgi:hypothetical protein
VNREKPSGLVTLSSALVDRKLAHLFALTQRFNFLTDKIPEAVKLNQALGFRAHEQVAPNTTSPYRVVDEELKRAIDLEDPLSDPFGRWIMFVGERNTDSEPPTKGLSSIVSNI